MSDTASRVAGTQNGTQSSSNSAAVWKGVISLPIGYYNLTIEYHSGSGNGTLIVRSGSTNGTAQVSPCCYAFDVILVLQQL